MTVPGSCHCGAVRYEVPAAPEAVTDCNCSTCRRRGTLWAYYSPREVRVDGPTRIYMWGDRDLEFHFCGTCGCVTHWWPVDKSLDRMGVNARLMEPEILAAARVRKFDGADTWKFLDGT
ncbi:MAG: GFA family protein [Rhizomicrobium sp.]